jgi:hypothetical protein
VSCELTRASALMVLFLSFPPFLLDTESLDYGNVLWRHDTLIFVMRRWLELGLFLKIKINLVLCIVRHMVGWQWGRTAHGRLPLAFGRMSVASISCHPLDIPVFVSQLEEWSYPYALVLAILEP